MSKGPSSSEHAYINQFLAPLAGAGAEGLTDDCAQIDVGGGKTLLISKDIAVAGRHFPEQATPEVIANRALGSALSDIAASGGTATAYMMGIQTPSETAAGFLKALSLALHPLQARFGIHLLGGDTVSADKTSLSITVFGETKKAVTRKGAKPGDTIFVSGSIGESAAALPYIIASDTQCAKRHSSVANAVINALIDRYNSPQPRLALGPIVSAYASSAIDISDGLAVDALRIADISGVGMAIKASEIPASQNFMAALVDPVERTNCQLTGGDDYEILATIPQENTKQFKESAEKAGVSVTPIGLVVNGPSTVSLHDGREVSLDHYKGFDHFAD